MTDNLATHREMPPKRAERTRLMASWFVVFATLLWARPAFSQSTGGGMLPLPVLNQPAVLNPQAVLNQQVAQANFQSPTQNDAGYLQSVTRNRSANVTSRQASHQTHFPAYSSIIENQVGRSASSALPGPPAAQVAQNFHSPVNPSAAMPFAAKPSSGNAIGMPPKMPLVDAHLGLNSKWHSGIPPLPTPPVIKKAKTPYSYGYFGAGRKRHWSRHYGYRDRHTDFWYR